MSQSQLATRLEFDKGAARISEYEHSVREPDLFVLLRYARAAGVSVDVLIDDDVKVAEIRRRHFPQ